MPEHPRTDAPPLPDPAIVQEATITERDRVEDVAFWKAHGSPLTQALLDAKPDEAG